MNAITSAAPITAMMVLRHSARPSESRRLRRHVSRGRIAAVGLMIQQSFQDVEEVEGRKVQWLFSEGTYVTA